MWPEVRPRDEHQFSFYGVVQHGVDHDRLGYLSGHKWTIKPPATKKLLNGTLAPAQLTWRDAQTSPHYFAVR